MRTWLNGERGNTDQKKLGFTIGIYSDFTLHFVQILKHKMSKINCLF